LMKLIPGNRHFFFSQMFVHVDVKMPAKVFDGQLGIRNVDAINRYPWRFSFAGINFTIIL